MKKLLVLLTAIFFCGCFRAETTAENSPPVSQNQAPSADERAAKLSRVKQSIAPFFKPMGKPLPTDWLATFDEPGQTFEEYLKINPTLPTAERKTIYIQPVGKFSASQEKVLRLTAEYMRAFYGLPVELKFVQTLKNVPPGMTRKNLYSGQTQIKASYFIDQLLPALVPKDAAAMICFTDADLYPEKGWSFVFGQASLKNRVGVWSLYRLGNPDKSEKEYQKFLFNVLKIAMHETGHMFSMWHCTKYECLMSGTNNLNETERRPLDVCPECMAKISWAMNYDSATRYRSLAKFWAAQSQTELSREFAAKEKAVGR
jgi:archaemetzincin